MQKKKVIKITDQELIDLRNSLKDIDNGWVSLLVEKIKADQPDTKFFNVNSQTIYNVFGSRFKRGQAWKLIVLKNGKELLAELQDKILQAKQA